MQRRMPSQKLGQWIFANLLLLQPSIFLKEGDMTRLEPAFGKDDKVFFCKDDTSSPGPLSLLGVGNDGPNVELGEGEPAKFDQGGTEG